MFLWDSCLLHTEGLTVSTLLLCGIDFVGTDLNLIQRAVVFSAAVMGALGYSAGDALVGLVILKHDDYLLYSWYP